MARYGFRSKNKATGSVQIDDLYSNLAMLSKGSVAVSDTGTIVFTGTDFPVLAVRSTVAIVILNVVRDNGANTWTFTIKAKAATTVYYYLFAEPTELGTGWGMRIKKAGKVIYDSRHRYVRQVSTLRGTADVNVAVGAAGPSATLASGPTYAVILGGRTGRAQQTVVEFSNGEYVVGQTQVAFGISINGGAIASEMLLIGSNSGNYTRPPAPPPPSQYQFRQPQYSWAIIDVTNF